MKSKNLSKLDLDHMGRVKSLPCGVCGMPGPSDAHHILQGMHYLTIPLCKSCHTNSRLGWHGERAAWKIRKINELDVLNDTIRKISK